MNKQAEVKKETENLPVVPEQPKTALPMVIDYGDDEGAGLEDVSREEFKIPLYRILQSNSPQCKPVANGGVEGAKAGMILNTATGELFDGEKGLLMIPVHRDHNFVEYFERKGSDGGGFYAVHLAEDPLVETLRAKQGKFGKLKRTVNFEGNEKNTEIAETFYLYSLLGVNEDEMIQGVVPFVSTQISKYQAFMTRYMGITYPNSSGAKVRPPLWAHRWRLRTAFQTNRKGDFYGWVVTLDAATPIESRMRLDDALYQSGRAFYDLLKEGKAKVAHEADAAAGGGSDAAQPSEEIPF